MTKQCAIVWRPQSTVSRCSMLPTSRAQRIRLSGTDRFVDLVVLPNGRGVLWSDNLTPIVDGGTYQFWVEVHGALVATTDLGRDPRIVAVSIPADALKLVITESRKGDPRPTDRQAVSGSRDPG